MTQQFAQPSGEPVDQGLPKKRSRKSVHWREDPLILARLCEVERRHLAGWPNTRIATALKVDEITIRRDLERLNELWIERTAAEQHAMRARAAAELEDIRQRALAAAEFDEAAERAVIYGQDADGNRVSVERDRKGSVTFRGQKAQALQTAVAASLGKARILGLVTDKQEHSGPGGGPIRFDDVSKLSDDEVDARLAELVAIGEARVPEVAAGAADTPAVDSAAGPADPGVPE